MNAVRFVCVIALGLSVAPRALAQADDADKKTVQRLLPEMNLVPSLYGRDAFKVNALPKFSAKKLLEYPYKKKDSVESERAAWQENKEKYAKTNVLRAAIFEAMESYDGMKTFQFAMTLPAGEQAPKDRADILSKQEPVGKMTFELEMQLLPKLKAAAKERDKEKNRRWQADFDLVYTRVLGNIIYVSEYNYALGQVRAGKLSELGKNDDGWQIVIKDAKPHVTEAAVKQYAKERGELLKKIQEEHAGTPWAYFAQRDADRPLGMEWAAKRK